jgi:HSP20 family protein
MFLARPIFSSNHLARREMDDLFNSVFAGTPLCNAGQRRPAVNFYEEPERFVAEAEVPGLTLDEIEVSIADAVLTIQGKHAEQKADEANPQRKVRSFGEFTCSVSVPAEVDTERVEATLKNGILTISMPKAPAVKPKQIAVRNG